MSEYWSGLPFPSPVHVKAYTQMFIATFICSSHKVERPQFPSNGDKWTSVVYPYNWMLFSHKRNGRLMPAARWVSLENIVHMRRGKH